MSQEIGILKILLLALGNARTKFRKPEDLLRIPFVFRQSSNEQHTHAHSLALNGNGSALTNINLIRLILARETHTMSVHNEH